MFGTELPNPYITCFRGMRVIVFVSTENISFFNLFVCSLVEPYLKWRYFHDCRQHMTFHIYIERKL
jgi:hypothetical protein